MSVAIAPAVVADAVRAMHARIDVMRDELNAADRAIGDGDTGMTIASVIGAWHAALDHPYTDLRTMLQQLGRETRRATGSSLGSVLGIGLAAAGRADDVSLSTMLDAAIAAISERSGAAPGDKTILDSLVGIRDALASRPGGLTGAVTTALDAAQRALDEFRDREAKIGRARMYGAKSAGHDDPGMLAAVLMLRAIV